MQETIGGTHGGPPKGRSRGLLGVPLCSSRCSGSPASSGGLLLFTLPARCATRRVRPPFGPLAWRPSTAAPSPCWSWGPPQGPGPSSTPGAPPCVPPGGVGRPLLGLGRSLLGKGRDRWRNAITLQRRRKAKRRPNAVHNDHKQWMCFSDSFDSLRSMHCLAGSAWMRSCCTFHLRQCLLRSWSLRRARLQSTPAM